MTPDEVERADAARHEPSLNIERLYRYADALDAAWKAYGDISFGVRPLLDAALDLPMQPDDMADVARVLREHADDWQAELDTARAEREEADDRRRANPLEPKR